ncbi:SDR family NAD(P)-dependent oxidoreductase [Halomarina salina]|uniref:SDR family NAD(P)-dependent oxidoreductase n=1 Tax=Halomarina salina TaxID=1872699 RepID=A0ABD5RJ46_9EURY|nr:SDR family NAD(P)-dependent oxidoreductase [Halomarina salina]
METPLYESLDGQVALVTGATRGIGAAVAAGLVDLGATVYAGARNADDVTAVDQRPIRLDVTEDATVEAAVDRVDDEAGRLDVLVNNAGVAPPNVPLHETTTADIDATLSVNLRGPMVVTRAALPLLLDGVGGRVVNVSSGDGAFEDPQEGYHGVAGPGYPSYRVSKAGLNGFTRYLDGEYASDGLVANAVCPGAVRTDMGSDDAPRTPAEGAATPLWLARFTPEGPSGSFWRDRERIPW